MINTEEFVTYIDSITDFMCGVPCSYYKDFLSYIENNKDSTKIEHIIATREDEAIGIASGIVLSGKRVIVYLQNSGLGNIGDALSSLAQLYKLPMLLLVSYRGLEPDNDFPEHSIQGIITEPLLESTLVPFYHLTEENWQIDLKTAFKKMTEKSIPVVLLVKQGVLSL